MCQYAGFSGKLWARLCCLAAAFVLAVSCVPKGSSVKISPSGTFRAYLSTTPCSGGWRVWVVNITADHDQPSLMEAMPDHPACLMAYLAWDGEERLWWYSSDDGSIFLWELSEGGWTRQDYLLVSDVSIVPPEELHLARNRPRGER